jgi:hypothetical protein
MRDKSERKYSFYTCGKCKGSIPFSASKGRPTVCPECGYGHGTRSYRDVPNIINANLRDLGQEPAGSRGKLEQSTITSR